MLKSKEYPWQWLLWPPHCHIVQNEEEEEEEKKKKRKDQEKLFLTDQELSKPILLQLCQIKDFTFLMILTSSQHTFSVKG